MPDLEEIVLPDGSTRRLGNNAPPGNTLMGAWKVYGDTPDQPMLNRDQWKPVDMRSFLPPVMDQDGVGACNAFDTVMVAEGCRAIQGHVYGSPTYKALSPGYLYGLINGGRDQGSMLEDAIKQMQVGGTCLTSTVAPLDWRHRPASAKDEALGYRLLESYWCPTFAHMASAIQAGFFVSCGLLWYNNFNTNGDGWLPLRGSGRPGGHALARCGLALNKDGKTWGLDGPNSWTPQWGANGYCVIGEPLFNEQIGGFWASRQMVDEGGIVPAPSA